MYQFSVKTDSFEFFGLNLGKLPNYVRYFGSYNVEDVAESCLEAEMNWVELGGSGGARWRWVVVDGVAWGWMHGLAIPVHKIYVNTNLVLLKKSMLPKKFRVFLGFF